MLLWACFAFSWTLCPTRTTVTTPILAPRDTSRTTAIGYYCVSLSFLSLEIRHAWDMRHQASDVRYKTAIGYYCVSLSFLSREIRLPWANTSSFLHVCVLLHVPAHIALYLVVFHCIYTYIHTHTHHTHTPYTHTHTHTHTCIYIHICIYIYIYIYIHIYIYIYIQI